MKALSLHQPWASLVVHGLKRIETRRHRTSHRGPMLIHASKTVPLDAIELIANSPPFAVAMRQMNYRSWKDLPTGCLVGVVSVRDVITTTQAIESRLLSDEELRFGNYHPNRSAWLLEDPMKFLNPMPFRGTMILWETGLSEQDLQACNPTRYTLPSASVRPL